MASSLSSSSSAQVRLLGIGSTASSSRNVAFRQRSSSLNSNRVSFGLPPRPSTLTLNTSNNARRSYSILSVAAKGSSSSDTSVYDALERLAMEAGKILVKEVANRFEEASKHLPEGAADEVQRLVEEAANALSAGETKEKRSGDVAKSQNHAASDSGNANALAAGETKEKRSGGAANKTEDHAASGNRDSYMNKLAREAEKEGKVLMVLDLTKDIEEKSSADAQEAAKTFSKSCKIEEKKVADEVKEAAKKFTEYKIKERRDAEEAERVKAEEADKWFAAHGIKEKIVVPDDPEEAAKWFAECKQRRDEKLRLMTGEAAARRINEKKAAEEAARVLEEEAAARKIKEKRAADEAARVMAEEAAARKIKEKKAADEAARVLAEEAAAHKIKEKKAAAEAARVLEEDAAAREIKQKRAADEAERLMAEEAAAHKIKEKKAADEAARVLEEEAAAHKIKEKRVAEEFARVVAADETEKQHSPSGFEGWVEAVDEFFGLMKPYLSTVRDSYDVNDYIKVRIGTDLMEGLVISKDYNVTRIQTYRTDRIPRVKRIIAIDNHKISWVEIVAKPVRE